MQSEANHKKITVQCLTKWNIIHLYYIRILQYLMSSQGARRIYCTFLSQLSSIYLDRLFFCFHCPCHRSEHLEHMTVCLFATRSGQKNRDVQNNNISQINLWFFFCFVLLGGDLEKQKKKKHCLHLFFLLSILSVTQERREGSWCFCDVEEDSP